MNEEAVSNYLKKQTKAVLLDLLNSASNEMNTSQRRAVFGNMVKQMKPTKLEKNNVLKDVKEFCNESLAGVYYAPFDINSKNYTHIPEETEEWFEKLNDHLLLSTRLTKQKDHSCATDCFSLLYDLIDKMEDGDEIIFADEYGTWMLPGDEKVYISAYIASLAAVKSPEEYAKATVPLLRKDSYESFSNRVYSIAINAASKDQQKCLKVEISKHKIRIK